MPDLFTTPAQALAACEDAGLEPRTQHGGLGETSYWVSLGGAYMAYWSDAQFLGWANAYFTRRAARLAADWTFAHGTWFSPCGMPESDWAEESLPFPEDADYAEWASVYFHYEALDNDTNPGDISHTPIPPCIPTPQP